MERTAEKIEDACRFCWMCRHLCPVALVTGNEADTPRGRAFVLSMDRRGYKFNSDQVDMIYRCNLCYACTDDCATGYDPTVFTRAARTKAVVGNMLTGHLKEVVDKILQGELPVIHDEETKEYKALLSRHNKKADLLVYRGGWKSLSLPFLTLLEKNNIPFKLMEKEAVSGSLAWDLVGVVDDVKQFSNKWVKELDESEAKTVICLDNNDVFFSRDQMARWEVKTKAQIITTVAFLTSLEKEGKLKKVNKNLEVTYHDPSRLARNLMEIEEPRELIKYSGANLKELFLHGHLARSSGGIELKELYPDLAAKIEEGLWEDIKRLGVKTVVTTDLPTYSALKESAPEGYKVLEISELLQ